MDRTAAYYDSLEKSLAAIDLKKMVADHGPYHPSPTAWEDEVLYFLLLDRFSDGKEFDGFSSLNGEAVVEGNGRTTPLFTLADAYTANRSEWFENGKHWCGGTLAGLSDKLGYLQQLGITAIWISPVFKQVLHSEQSYHGYGIQNFLDVDPHFGTRDELKELVAAAHRAGIRIVLDMVLNHAGDIFSYKGGYDYHYYDGWSFEADGYKKEAGDQQGSLPFDVIDLQQHADAWPHGAIWPRELQQPGTWTLKGKIDHWDSYPEYLEGDFDAAKNINHGQVSEPAEGWDKLKQIRLYQRANALEYLCRIHQYWIAYADIDGYRLDTVKHLDPGAVRYFTNCIHEFAQQLGKENFYIIGEITFGRKDAVDLVDITGLDAALGIDGVQDKLEFLAKGWRVPGNPYDDNQEGYFDLFNNSLVDGKSSHQWYAKRIVTMFDDHDQVGTTHKFRYCGQRDNDNFASLPVALALNLTTIGIPCIYYGTEQAFDGADKREGTDSEQTAYSDVFLRECMFGGGFGSLQSSGKHFFNQSHPIYQYIQQLCLLRKKYPALRRGRQYLQKISGSGDATDFYYPTQIGNELRWVVAWSRAYADAELICAINTDTASALTVWVTVAPGASDNAPMACIFTTNAAVTPIGHQTIIQQKGLYTAVKITVPPAGFVVYEKV